MRLKLNRLSLQADLLKGRSKSTVLDFTYSMVADFVLWFRSAQRALGQFDRSHLWWPDTLVFLSFRPSPPFELFARAKSTKYFDEIKSLLGVDN
jgi:hypothetical protein